jgi:hypothetical protein
MNYMRNLLVFFFLSSLTISKISAQPVQDPLQIDKTPQIEKSENEKAKQEVKNQADRVVEEAKKISEPAGNWLNVQFFRLVDSTYGLWARIPLYHLDVAKKKLDAANESLKKILAKEADSKTPDYTAIHDSLSEVVRAVNELEAIRKDANYLSNWHTGLVATEAVGAVGSGLALVRKAQNRVVGLRSRTRIIRKTVAPVAEADQTVVAGKKVVERTMMPRAALWPWLTIFVASLAYDRLYVVPTLRHLDTILDEELLNTAEMYRKLIQIDALVISKDKNISSAIDDASRKTISDAIVALENDRLYLKSIREQEGSK